MKMLAAFLVMCGVRPTAQEYDVINLTPRSTETDQEMADASSSRRGRRQRVAAARAAA